MQAYPAPEDYGGENKDKPVPVNADVERARRYPVSYAPPTQLHLISRYPCICKLSSSIGVKCNIYNEGIKLIGSNFYPISFFRAHQNDVENIPIFLIIALLYLLSNLSPVRGIWCLRIFTAARILYTVGYLSGITRPRGIGFRVGSVCMAVLGVSVLYSAVTAGVF